jgi:hypothetical protein
MVDPELKGLYPVKSLSRFADVIALCVQVMYYLKEGTLVRFIRGKGVLKLGTILQFLPKHRYWEFRFAAWQVLGITAVL